MKIIKRLKKEFASLYTPSKESVIKSTVGVMCSSVILSLIIFGLSTGVTELIALIIK